MTENSNILPGHIYTIDIVNARTRGYLNIISTYGVWTGYAILLVILSALFVRLISPQAIGSGIPEMKVQQTIH